MSATKILNAEVRTNESKGTVKQLRSEGRVPAIIYGNNKPESQISLDSKEFLITYNKGGFFSRTIDIEVGKEKIKVLPQEIQFHPIKDAPLHADFLRVDDNSVVKVSIPVEFIGKEKSPGLKRGGVLNAVRRTVDVYCKVSQIPESFTADVSAMKISENVKFSDLNVPEGVTPVIADRDFTIAAIAGRVAKEAVAGEVTEEVSTDEESEEA